MTRCRVLQVITRLIVGGAQETVMLVADSLNRHPDFADRYRVDVVTGPQTGPEGSLFEETAGREVPVRVLPQLRREISPLQDLVALLRLARWMRAGGYDVVHTNSSKAGVLGRVAAAWARIPVVVHTVHGWSVHDHMSRARHRFYRALERRCARLSTALIVVSQTDREKGLALGIGRRADYHVIRSGIELDRFGHPRVGRQEMRRRLGLPAGALVVGCVTRFSRQKAPLDLVAGWERVAAQRPATRFVLVGDGPLRSEVERRLRRSELGDRTVLTGLRRDVPELMGTFDVFALSSLWEGLPRVLPQAMATGLPIVATAADGSAEAVREGVNGHLVARGDTEAMAARILDLLDDRQGRQRMGEAGRSLSIQYGAETMTREIDRLYRRLLSAGGDDPP